MKAIVLFLLTLFSICAVHAQPIKHYKGIYRHEWLEGNIQRVTTFRTWPAGNYLFDKHEEVYNFNPGGPILPWSANVQGEYNWYHVSPDGSLVRDWSIVFHVYPGMPANQPWFVQGPNVGVGLLMKPPAHMINRHMFSPVPPPNQNHSVSEDEYCLAGFTLTNATGVPYLFTLNYSWDRAFPNPDVFCWTRFVVQPYSVRQVVPMMNGCLLHGLDSELSGVSGSVYLQPFTASSAVPRSQNPMAIADNCSEGALNPTPIPSVGDILYYLGPSGGIFNTWPAPH